MEVPKIPTTRIKDAISRVKKTAPIAKEAESAPTSVVRKSGLRVAGFAAGKLQSVALGAKGVGHAAARAAGVAGSAVVGTVGGFAGQVHDRMLIKEEEAIMLKARRAAIASSVSCVEARRFVELFEEGATADGGRAAGYLDMSGCYVIVTMPNDRTKDSADFQDVYVGCGSNIGADAYRQLKGFGNVDVYADFKYARPMRLLAYPCNEDKIPETLESLMFDLQSVASYNKWEVLSD